MSLEDMVVGVGPVGFFLINMLVSMVPLPAAGVMCVTAGAMFGLTLGTVSHTSHIDTSAVRVTTEKEDSLWHELPSYESLRPRTSCIALLVYYIILVTIRIQPKQALYVASGAVGSAIALYLGRDFLTPLVIRLINWFYGGTAGQDKVGSVHTRLSQKLPLRPCMSRQSNQPWRNRNGQANTPLVLA